MCCPPRSFTSIRKLVLLLATFPLISCLPGEPRIVKPGRYIPELYGAHLGKYVPDDSGKYFHIHRPYDGGYGDTGVKYVHDARGNLVPLSTKLLGPRDHLRFMLDFNFDNSGWQIINFEWLRDGDENYNYRYVNENQLFMGHDAAPAADADAKQEASPATRGNETNIGNGVHIEGEYSDKNAYNYAYNNSNGANNSSEHLQQAIREVIYYIENNILPSL